MALPAGTLTMTHPARSSTRPRALATQAGGDRLGLTDSSRQAGRNRAPALAPIDTDSHPA
jgi:hypothetical protein